MTSNFSRRKFLIPYFFLLSTPGILPANILFLFAGGNVSHKMNIWPFVVGLAEAGHNVTFTSSSDKIISQHPGITDITPPAFIDYTKGLYALDRVKARQEGDEWDIISSNYHVASINFCKVLFDVYERDVQFRSLFQRDKTDLVVINGAFNECGFYLIHLTGVKFISYSSTTIFPWHYKIYGAPVEASVIPDLMARAAHPPGILDRMWNVYRHYKGYSRDSNFIRTLEELYRDRVKTAIIPPPKLEDVERNASLVFINSHYSIDFPRSLPPVFVNIGGLQCWSNVGELPSEFQTFMDGAEEGVILITFGSTINFATLDPKFTNGFLNMMKKFDKVRFIWKWDGPMPIGAPPNVMAASWLPQRKILNHPKTVAFMTHGGSNSVTEATFHGVPLIVFPLFADQDFNAYRIRARGLGISVEFKTFSQTSLDAAVREILTNKMYKKNMLTMSKIFKDRVRSPIEEAVSWTAFALRQDDTSALKPMLLDQPWCVRNSVDAYFGFFVILVLFPLFLLYCINRVVKLIFGPK